MDTISLQAEQSASLIGHEDGVSDITVLSVTNGAAKAATAAIDPDEIEDKYGGVFIWLVAGSAALGGFLFGYDSTVIAGVLVMIKDDLGAMLSPSQQELITSIASVGAFVGALLAGLLLDKIGRKAVIGLGALVFAIGSILQGMAMTVRAITLGRFIVGLGIGEAAMVAPIYIAEIAPAKLRGGLVTVDALAITGGQCIAGAVNIFLQDVRSGWRLSVGIAAIPSFVLLGLCFVIPESPRSLIYQNKLDQARAVTADIYPNATAEQVQNKVAAIHAQFAAEAELRKLTTWDQFRLLFTDSANFRALIVACGLMAIQQLSGSNSVFYYGPTLFGLVGFGNPIAVAFIMALTNFVFTMFALKYIDTVGRRKFLVNSMWGMPAALAIAAIALLNIPISPDLTITDPTLTLSGVVVLFSIVFFIASYAIALGSVPWQCNELFPMEVRALGTMMLTLTNWSLNAVVSSSFLSLMKTYTPSGAFGIYAINTLLGWIAVIYCYPEVSGLPLEAIKDVFNHGFGVNYSLKLQKERALRNGDNEEP
ncbi:general substrate transporter [Lipomyces tetrasporus]|uniref:General substrate transporter n=1 Tax=Lipomyces tetrasporus TaxID=54092 RepID=A0AAD7QMQ0_9ASCO|nr:general substrate transporter [Lipomyces tetrasporus]KAJ8098180.1 general substrate transporter [Lipomyces tetrasporus]